MMVHIAMRLNGTSNTIHLSDNNLATDLEARLFFLSIALLCVFLLLLFLLLLLLFLLLARLNGVEIPVEANKFTFGANEKQMQMN